MPQPPRSENEPFIDVERLVVDLRARVERERAAGRYADDLDSIPLPPATAEPSPLEDSGRAEPPPAPPGPRVQYRPEVGYSSRRVVGPILSAFKRVFYRFFFYPLDDLARQTDAAVRELFAARSQLEHAIAVETAARQEAFAAETAARQAVMGRVDTLVNQLELTDQLEARAREAVQRDVQNLAVRLAELETTLERLQLPSRLGRLERLSRTTPPARASAAPLPAAPVATGQQMPSFDYMTFENRFRPENTVRERQRAYLEVLRDRKRVVDLGCGRGELLELLREAGVSAYGVEVDPDFVAVCQERGLEIVEGDAVAHVEALEPEAVDGIVVSHVIEHFTHDQLWRLITKAAETLGDGGILIMETPNPESLLAGSINFHRDPTHVRPVHPDTLSFLCESAGFHHVEIRRLARVPDEERLPAPSGEDGRLADDVSELVKQLNELIYGYQDYALLARA